MKTIILKKSIFTAKFGVVFPAKTELRYFTDKETGKRYLRERLKYDDRDLLKKSKFLMRGQKKKTHVTESQLSCWLT